MLKSRFSFNDLNHSFRFYFPIIERLFYAEHYYFKKKGYQMKSEYFDLSDDEIEAMGNEYRVLITLEKGWDDISYLTNSVDSINSGFAKLLDNAEVQAAFALVRIQLDNLTYIFAELQHPFQVLYKVFAKGRTLNQITIDGKQLNPSAIRKELDEKCHTNICELYKKYSCFIHPNKEQNKIRMNEGYNSNKKERQTLSIAKQKEYAKDMIYINQLLARLMLIQVSAFNTGIIDYGK